MRALLLAMALVMSAATCCWGAGALVLQSGKDGASRDAVRGLAASYPGKMRVVVLSEYTDVDVVGLVREVRPQVVVAVGEAAVAASAKVRDVPLVTMLSPCISHRKLPHNVCALNVVAEPGKYMELFGAMRKRRVGVVYDPDKSGRYLRQAVQTARSYGVTLETMEVHSPQEVQSALEKLKGRVDALWVLPDSTVVSVVNMEAFTIFSMSNRVPVVSYLNQHLHNGAAASLVVDFFDIGRQAGELCLQLLRKGGVGAGGSVIPPRKATLHTNDGVIRKLGITLTAS